MVHLCSVGCSRSASLARRDRGLLLSFVAKCAANKTLRAQRCIPSGLSISVLLLRSAQTTVSSFFSAGSSGALLAAIPPLLVKIRESIGVGKRGQGRNEGAQFPGRRKVPTMSQVLSSIQYICFRKTLGSNMGTPNFSGHGRNLTSLRPWEGLRGTLDFDIWGFSITAACK